MAHMGLSNLIRKMKHKDEESQIQHIKHQGTLVITIQEITNILAKSFEKKELFIRQLFIRIQ